MQTQIGAPDVSALPPSATATSVYIIDDHPLFRDGLARCMSQEPDLTLAGQAGSLERALTELRTLRCDVVTLDLALDGEDGLDFLQRARGICPTVRVLVVSRHDETQYALAALRAGAHGYVTKYERPETLMEAIRAVAAGQVFVSERFRTQLIYRVISARNAVDNPLNVISARELDVLQLVGHGCLSARIAELLGLSVKTVEAHRLHIKEKLSLSNAAELVRFAHDWVKYAERGRPSAAAAAA